MFCACQRSMGFDFQFHLSQRVRPIPLVQQSTSWAPIIPLVKSFVFQQSLGNGCTRNELRDCMSGNRVQQLRSDSATLVFNRCSKRKPRCFRRSSITHCSSNRHDSPTTIRTHPVVHLAFPCTERYPRPMKLPRQMNRHSTWTHRSTVLWDFNRNVTLSRQHQFCCKSGNVSSDAIFSRLMTCALMCMMICRYHLCQSVVECFLPDNRTRRTEADTDSTNGADLGDYSMW